MNDNSKKWVELLRSGKYEQGTGRLHCPENNTFCCLGVACELYRKEYDLDSLVGWSRDGVFIDSNGSTNSETLTNAVRRWLGLKNPAGDYGDYKSLADDNDGGLSFYEIADIIESEPEGLFE